MNPTVLYIATHFKSLETQLDDIKSTLLKELADGDSTVCFTSSLIPSFFLIGSSGRNSFSYR